MKAQRKSALDEVGKQFDVTRERIRQIESKALRKLQHHTRSIHLKGFVEAGKGGQQVEGAVVAAADAQDDHESHELE